MDNSVYFLLCDNNIDRPESVYGSIMMIDDDVIFERYTSIA